MERRWWWLIIVVFLLFTVVQYFLLYGKLLTSSSVFSKAEQANNATRNYTTELVSTESAFTASEYVTKHVTEHGNYSRLSMEQQEILKVKLKRASYRTKYILYWYGKHVKSERRWPTEICGKCEFTNDQNMINHPDTGAVIFLYKKFAAATLPKVPRRRDQLHVWYTGEAPSSLYTMRHIFLALEDRYKFNLTQTYRRDSGIYHPYGSMEEILKSKWEHGEQKNISKILKEKTKVAVAVVSNCNATAGAKLRIQLIEKMKELGLEIDTFGRCFEQNISETHHEFEHILKKYKFFLAFENAYHCRDYITEKFYINGFRANTVPIALGATKKDYEAVAPSDSFIFAEDFSSVASLVNYIRYLDKNDEEYLKYFRWVERGQPPLPMRGRIGRFCQLCRQIHGINVDDVYHPLYNASNPERPLFTDGIAERNVPALRNWYYNTESRECFERTPKRMKRFLNFSDFLPT